MGKIQYSVIGGINKKIKKKYSVIDGITKKIKKEYAVFGGNTKLIWCSYGLYYAVSTDYKFYKSDDGEAWEYVSDLPSLSAYSINYPDGTRYSDNNIAAYKNIIIIRIGKSYEPYVYSLDYGKTWTVSRIMYSEFNGTEYFYPTKIIAGNGIFLAIVSYEDQRRLVYSTNGISWNRCNNAPSVSNNYIHIASLNYANGIYTWEGNNISIYSHDGMTWNTNLGDLINGYSSLEGTKIIYNDNKYVGIIRRTSYYYFRTGITGTNSIITGNVSGGMFDIVSFKNNVYITTYYETYDQGGESATITLYKLSDDLISLSRVFSSSGYNYTLSQGEGTLVANDDTLMLRLCNGNYYKTTDGNTWTLISASGNNKINMMPTYCTRITD